MKVAKLALLALPLSLYAEGAHAYVCTPVTNASPPLSQAWNQRCIPYFISRSGSLIGGEERRALIANAWRQWSGEMNSCTDLQFVDAGYTDELSGFDSREPSAQINVIASIESPDQLSMFPDRNLLAITLTSFSVETGEIFDADVLINAVNNKFGEVDDPSTCNRQSGDFDLSNTLVHEFGHAIGFDHETKQDSTMFASAERCENKKRDLSDDDRFGLCSVYGAGMPTMTCAAPASYDAAQGRPERFRDQCERLNGDGGCNCVETASLAGAPATSTDRSHQIAAWLFACGLLAAHHARKRR